MVVPKRGRSRIILEGVKGTTKTSARMTGESEYRNPCDGRCKTFCRQGDIIKVANACAAEYVTRGIQF